ncbi:unnamed protein product [Hermetia illucens]|uniref:Cathepsin propeptide inhibitor domain-containing protein n=1 Tax=Hermetia illucens TaxID=343691 RepID=A0A7R8UU93_HERIL|nr:unnamed protein product [Hermetia illucens]
MITHLIIYFLFSIVTLTSGDVEKLDADLEWEAFKAKFNKFYPSLDEEIFRKAVFKDNLNFINYHNQISKILHLIFKSKMKLTIVLGLLVVLQVVSSAEKYGSLDEEWEKYKVDFEKHYSSAEEEAKRKAIFGKTLEQI